MFYCHSLLWSIFNGNRLLKSFLQFFTVLLQLIACDLQHAVIIMYIVVAHLLRVR